MDKAPETRILIDTREDLLYLLAEAAEIEHNLMCCYLYAAWSLKGDGYGLSPDELNAVQGWKRSIISVAVEEMSHLTLASNLMLSIGGAAHLTRPNFPVAQGYHPSGVIVELARFDMETLDHFIYLERPEGNAVADAASFAHTGEYHRSKRERALMPSSQDYETVGHLYRGIRDGFDAVTKAEGETALFCGHAQGQVSPQDAGLPGLMIVKDLASAHKAIDTIVEQGEGAPGHHDTGHYARFLAVKREFDALRTANPTFDPAHPCARNPVMRRPMNPESRVHIDQPEAAAAVDVGNALYGVMLRCLAQSMGRSEPASKRMLLDCGIDSMFAMAPVAEHLATLPANEKHPGVTAGLTFTMLRDVGRMPEGDGEIRFLRERLGQIATRAREIFPKGHALEEVAAQADAVAAKLAVTEPQKETLMATEIQAGTDVAEGKDVAITFSGKRCIHARFCVLGAPTVFKANTPGEWIFPDTMPVEKLVAVAEACPSGAITYARKDGKPDEQAPPVNVARIRENGPYAINAPMMLKGASIGFRAVLCRCGASKNKPFCDGSHKDAGFAASGEPDTRDSQPLAARDGALEITPFPNGPLGVSGSLEIVSGTGRTVDRVTRASLCRCGASASKPFCDGSHKRVGFTAPS
jgi:CDGSH-type Zn-finger protein/uncharacterized Fe-S cluster protein YjdI